MNIDECKKILKENFKEIDSEFIDDFTPIILNDYNNIKFPINLNTEFNWLGYTLPRNAIRVLTKVSNKFIENTDYAVIIQQSTNSPPTKTYMLSVDCFKMMSMMAPTEMGRIARRYYVELEKYVKKYLNDKTQTKFTNPTLITNKYDFDINQWKNKDVLYLICITKDLYKFGITHKIDKRLSTHKHLIGYDYVIKCWDCFNRSITKEVEDDIKRFIKFHKINRIYKGQTEVFEHNDINAILLQFDKYVADAVDHNNNTTTAINLSQGIKLEKEKQETISDLTKLHSLPNFNNVDAVINNQKIFELLQKIEDKQNQTQNQIKEIIKEQNQIITNDQIKAIIKEQTNEIIKEKVNEIIQTPINNDHPDNENSNFEHEIKEIMDSDNEEIINETNTQKCTKCKVTRKLDCFGPKLDGIYYKQCDKCREQDKKRNIKRAESKKQYNAEYHEKNAEKIKQQQSEYHQKNKEARNEYQRNLRKTQKEMVNERDRGYYQEHHDQKLKQKKIYYDNNKDEIRDKQKNYYEENSLEIINQKHDTAISNNADI